LQGRTGRIAVLGGANLLPPTAAAVEGLDSLHGVAALVPQRTAELLACIEGPLFDPRDPRVGRPFLQRDSLTHPLLDLLAVDTVVHADPGLASATGWPVLFEDPAEGLGALARPTAGPRAFVCGGARLVPDKDARLSTLADRGLRPHATVLLERDPGLALPDEGPMRPASLERPSEDQVRLLTDAPFAGIAVMTESWSEGWSVRVDGETAEPLVADHALLGVALPPGPHTVEWRYAPPGLHSGMMLLGVGLAALAVLLVVRRRTGESG
jgi:Bacterial membrane protein YfhO